MSNISRLNLDLIQKNDELKKENAKLKKKNKDLKEYNWKLKNQYQLLEIQKNCADQKNERLETQLNAYKSKCEKAVDEMQQLIDNITNKTIIGLNTFLPKLEEIQDKLSNGGE